MSCRAVSNIRGQVLVAALVILSKGIISSTRAQSGANDLSLHVAIRQEEYCPMPTPTQYLVALHVIARLQNNSSMTVRVSQDIALVALASSSVEAAIRGDYDLIGGGDAIVLDRPLLIGPHSAWIADQIVDLFVYTLIPPRREFFAPGQTYALRYRTYGLNARTLAGEPLGIGGEVVSPIYSYAVPSATPALRCGT